MTEFNSHPHNGPKIIGLSGYATAGKDATADVLTRLYGYKRIAFGDGVKEFARRINPIVSTAVTPPLRVTELVERDGDIEAKKHPEYRRLLQVIGTEGVRQMFGDNIWIDYALDDIATDEYVVVTDVRFRNEAQAIKDRGGVVLRIQRPGVGPANQHASEISLDDWWFDDFVNNDGSLTDLEGEVQCVLGDLG